MKKVFLRRLHYLIITVLSFVFIFNSLFAINNIDSEVIKLINEERVKNGAKPLVLLENLNKMALYHSENMLNGDFFSNTDLDGLNANARQAKLYPEMIGAISENLYRRDFISLSDKSTAKEAFSVWINNPDNKLNILDKDYNHAGVGSAKKGINTYIVVTFANLVAEVESIPSEAAYGEDITVKYKILNGSYPDNFKVFVEFPDKTARVDIVGTGRQYVGQAMYTPKLESDNVISITFPAEYGRGLYKITLAENGVYYNNSLRTVTVK